jgi:hypothetical protein
MNEKRVVGYAISKLRSDRIYNYAVRFTSLVTFIIAVGALAYLLYSRTPIEIAERQQLAAETIALGALIVTAFGTLSTFIFNWRNDKRNERNQELEIANAVLESRLNYERILNETYIQHLVEINKIKATYNTPKQLRGAKKERGALPPKNE